MPKNRPRPSQTMRKHVALVEGGKLVAQLNEHWRLVYDGTRWKLQRFDGDWINQVAASIMPNMEQHIRKHVKNIDPAALAVVQALPQDYRLVLMARGQYRQPPPDHGAPTPSVSPRSRGSAVLAPLRS
jgi:hypothetical protein